MKRVLSNLTARVRKEVGCFFALVLHRQVHLEPFSYQKFSPKIFCLPFGHMHGALNVVKKQN